MESVGLALFATADSPAQDEEHIKCSSLRAELVANKAKPPDPKVDSHDDSKYNKRDVCDLQASRFI